MLPVGLCLEPFSFCSQYAPASKQGPHSSTAIAVETIGSAFEFRIKLSAADASVPTAQWLAVLTERGSLF